MHSETIYKNNAKYIVIIDVDNTNTTILGHDINGNEVYNNKNRYSHYIGIPLKVLKYYCSWFLCVQDPIGMTFIVDLRDIKDIATTEEETFNIFKHANSELLQKVQTNA